MESWGSFWMGLGAGCLMGAMVVALWGLWRARQAAKAGRSVEALEQTHHRFREEVNQHFVETAELINRMTDSYKAVFDHLSQGAERLVEERAVQERMPKVGDQEVKLKHIGHRVRFDGGSEPDEPNGEPSGTGLTRR